MANLHIHNDKEDIFSQQAHILHNFKVIFIQFKLCNFRFPGKSFEPFPRTFFPLLEIKVLWPPIPTADGFSPFWRGKLVFKVYKVLYCGLLVNYMLYILVKYKKILGKPLSFRYQLLSMFPWEDAY